MVTVAIDLGSQNSVVSIYKNGNVETIPDPASGLKTVSSYVSFNDEGDRIVGNEAKNLAFMYPKSTLYDCKRLMGKSFSDPAIQEIKSKYPFDIVSDKSDRVMVEIDMNGTKKRLYPEEVAGAVLSKMKSIAEDYTGEQATKCIVTIPSHFTDSARTATKNATKIAGFDSCLRLLQEPTSACLAYGIDKKRTGKKTNVLCVDSGALTTDISIVEIDDELFEVIATRGDSYMGGSDINNDIADFILAEFNRRHKQDASKSPKSVNRAKAAAEQAKKVLSGANSAPISIDAFYDGMDFNMALSKAKFEKIIEPFLNKLRVLIEECIVDSKLKKSEIHESILVGGTTRIPAIDKLVTDIMEGKKPSKGVDPDLSVSYGAAIQAAVIEGVQDDKVGDILLVDITPLNLGIKTDNAIMTTIIEKNSPIPIKKTQTFSTARNNQDTCTIEVLEGISELADRCRLLSKFNLEGIPPMPRGMPQILVEYSLDSDGILKVAASEKSSGNSKEIEIKSDDMKLDDKDMERMKADADKYKEEDDKRVQNIKLRNQLENTLYNKKNEIDAEQDVSIKEKLEPIVNEGIEWLDNNSVADSDTYERMIKEFSEKLGL